LKEFARVLKPGGALGLIWNHYDRDNWPDYQRKIWVSLLLTSMLTNCRRKRGAMIRILLSIAQANGLKHSIQMSRKSITSCPFNNGNTIGLGRSMKRVFGISFVPSAILIAFPRIKRRS
jgi:hypothetical protein